MNNRKQRAEIAQKTLQILEYGMYTVNGNRVEFRYELMKARENTEYFRPGDFGPLKVETGLYKDLVIEVTNETTFGAAYRLVNEDKEEEVLCLNFASAKNPGGGFLGGSQAQEESLARSSGLYPCIEQIKEYYEFHRSGKSCIYSDRMIYSPGVPVFRNDENDLLDDFYMVSIVTAPAVNCVKVSRTDAFEAMDIRIEKLLSLCAARGHSNLMEFFEMTLQTLRLYSKSIFLKMRSSPELLIELFSLFWTEVKRREFTAPSKMLLMSEAEKQKKPEYASIRAYKF